MAQEQGSLSRRYANAREVLPPELFREVQQHFTGKLWVLAGSQHYSQRRQLVVALKGQCASTREVARLAGTTPCRVRQILAMALGTARPT